MRLAVCFPRPRLSVISSETESERERAWTRELTGLPVRRAALRLAGGPAGGRGGGRGAGPVPPAAGFERFLSAAVAGGGQSAREVSEAQEWRRDGVERLAMAHVAGGRTPGPEETTGDDEEPAAGGNKVGDGRVRPTGRKAVARRAEVPTTMAQQAFLSAPAGTVAEDGSLA